MLPRATPTRALRTLAHNLSFEPPGWLHAVHGTDRHPTATPEVVVDDPEDLIGFVADTEWRGIALVLAGRARDIGDDETTGPWAEQVSPRPVTLSFVLDRQGRCAVAIRNGTHVDEIEGLRGASGFVADIARRILGLATEVEAGGTAGVFVSVWLRNVLDGVADPATAPELGSWSAVVSRHPAFTPSVGIVDGGPLPPPECDPDELAAITNEVARQLPWQRLHRFAADGIIDIPGLTPAEAGWMDWPFFARWALDVHRPVAELLDDLSLFIDGPLLRDVRYTVDAIARSGFADAWAS